MSQPSDNVLDARIRQKADEKLRHAFELRRDLYNRIYQGWWNSGPTSVTVELRDAFTVDYIVLAIPAPPTQDWWNRASDIFLNLRNALDRFHFAICRHFAGDEWNRHRYFPITKGIDGWKSWTGSHRMLPREIVARYLKVQPWYTGRPYLSQLSRVANLEKHSVGVAASVDIAGLQVGGNLTLEGLKPELSQLTAGSSLDITTGRQVIGSARFASKVIELGALSQQPTTRFEPQIVVDDERLPLLTTMDACNREAAWAISLVIGSTEASGPLPPHSNMVSHL
jgi:hypothetical protein